MKTRISRELPARELSPAEVLGITEVVFAPSRPRPSDLLLIFGASVSSGSWGSAAQLLREGFAPKALVTGGVPYQDGSAASEAQGIRSALVIAGVPASAILLEERSTNTLENVLFTKELLESLGALPKSLLFYCKSHQSGRARRTLTRYLPDVSLSCATYDAMYSGATLSATSWSETEIGVRRVLAEYERILVYGSRGDIAT